MNDQNKHTTKDVHTKYSLQVVNRGHNSQLHGQILTMLFSIKLGSTPIDLELLQMHIKSTFSLSMTSITADSAIPTNIDYWTLL